MSMKMNGIICFVCLLEMSGFLFKLIYLFHKTEGLNFCMVTVDKPRLEHLADLCVTKEASL